MLKEEINLNPIAKNILGKLVNLIEQDRIPFLNKFFPNGIIFRPKEGRAVTINAGNALHGFVLKQKGYRFLYEFFPADYPWQREVDKWWGIPESTTKESVEEIVKMFKRFDQSDIIVDKAGQEQKIDKPIKNSPLGSIGENFKLDLDPRPRPSRTSPENDFLLNEYGVLIFQDATGEKKIGYRNVEFKQFKDGKIIDRSTGHDVKGVDNNASPYYVTTYFPYAFEISEAEDNNLIPTRLEIVVQARCINPYYARVIVGDDMNMFTSIVTSVAQDAIRDIAMHTVLKPKESESDNGVVADDNALDQVVEKILNALHDPKNFFGYAIKSVQIVQVSIDGPDAEKLRTASTALYTAQQNKLKTDVEAEAALVKKQKETDGEVDAIKRTANAKYEATIKDAEAIQKALTITEPEKAAQLKNLLEQVVLGGANPNVFIAIEGLVKAFGKK